MWNSRKASIWDLTEKAVTAIPASISAHFRPFPAKPPKSVGDSCGFKFLVEALPNGKSRDYRRSSVGKT